MMMLLLRLHPEVEVKTSIHTETGSSPVFQASKLAAGLCYDLTKKEVLELDTISLLKESIVSSRLASLLFSILPESYC
jgi:hypothetical protein